MMDNEPQTDAGDKLEPFEQNGVGGWQQAYFRSQEAPGSSGV